MKKFLLFLGFVFLLLNPTVSWAQAPALAPLESAASDQSIDPLAEDSLAAAMPLLAISLAEYCQCKLKVQLFHRKFWLAEKHQLQDLLWVLQAGGRVLHTKHLNTAPDATKEAIAQSNIPPAIKAIITKQHTEECIEWKCRLKKLGGNLLLWFLEAYLNQDKVF